MSSLSPEALGPGFIGQVLDGGGATVGTCWLVAPGWVLTAAHVAQAAGADGADGGALPAAVAGLKVGDRVRHDAYGEGDVVALEGTGRSTVARVTFTVDGAKSTKRLMLRLAPIAKL